MACTISPTEFSHLGPPFCARLGDHGWRWVPEPVGAAAGANGDGFAVLKGHIATFGNASTTRTTADADATAEEDDACTLPGHRQRQCITTIECDVHVVYHATYRVPALFFRAAHLDGRPVRRATLVQCLAGPHSACGGLNGGDDVDGGGITDGIISINPDHFISDEEHPFTGTPFFVLHPCKTAARMRDLLCGGDGDGGGGAGDVGDGCDPNYLFSWYSLVAPALKLPLPPTLFLRCVCGGAGVPPGVGGSEHAPAINAPTDIPSGAGVLLPAAPR